MLVGFAQRNKIQSSRYPSHKVTGWVRPKEDNVESNSNGTGGRFDCYNNCASSGEIAKH